VTVDTPCGKYKGLQSIPYREMCAVSVMRSGDILLEAVRLVAPGIAVGKILVQRDESHPDKIPILYYSKLPEEISQMQVLLVDPMLATGGSAKMSIDVLVAAGAREENITFLNVVSCPEGLTALNKAYPRVRVITTAVDDKLDGHKYIVPGVGDFGDRYYRT
jgi:uracil phosphoribosyltransferase